MKKVLILGCGWVGEEVALHLLGKGYEVYASTTTIEKSERFLKMGISSFIHDFDLGSEPKVVWPLVFDYVLTSVPASTRITLSGIEKRFSNLYTYLTKLHFKKHIYLSSIGVYPNRDSVFREEYAGELVSELRLAETKLSTLKNTVVYRLGGLFGKSRVFARYFVEKVCTTGEEFANFVHLDDVVNLISIGFEKDLKSNLYNIVAPLHPTKKEVILASAKKYKYATPSAWDTSTKASQKLVDGSKIIEELSYHFVRPNPVNF